MKIGRDRTDLKPKKQSSILYCFSRPTASNSRIPMKRLALLVFVFTLTAGSAVAVHAASSPANRFVHASGKYLVDSQGHKLLLRGINLGNWMVPEGYMFGLDDGPVSPRE